MSYIPRTEQPEKIAPVSKESDLLLHDSLNWKELNFDFEQQRLCCIGKSLRGTNPDKITFYGYDMGNINLTIFPILISVKEIVLDWCDFPLAEGVRIMVKCFPSIRKLTIIMKCDPMDDDYNISYDYDQTCGLVKGIDHLQQWKSLKIVELDALHPDCFSLVVEGIVKQDHQLEELTLLKSGILDDSTLKTILEHQGRYLKKFSMFFHKITSTAFQELKRCENLRELSLFFTRELTDKEFLSTIQELKSLTFLRVEYSHKLFSAEFRKLLKDVTLPKLVELVLGHSSKIKNDDLKLIVECLPLLENLTLRDLKKISNRGLYCLPDVGSNLKSLHLEYMKHVTKDCLLKISRELPNLCEVVATTCPLISADEEDYCITFERFAEKTTP